MDRALSFFVGIAVTILAIVLLVLLLGLALKLIVILAGLALGVIAYFVAEALVGRGRWQ